MTSTAVAVAVAFVIGHFPGARLVEWIWHTRLDTIGTKNTGAGNATRSVGIKAGVVVALSDGLKGLLPVLAARALGLGPWSLTMIGLAIVAGNNWPVLANRRGGRGLATSVGVVVGLVPVLIIWPGVWSVIGWKIGGALAGFVGWGFLPAVAIITGQSMPVVALTAGLSAMMAIRRAQGNTGFELSAAAHRIVFDVDDETTPSTARARLPRRLAWALGLPVAYIALAWWVLPKTGLEKVDMRAALLLTGGVACEFAAKFAFGELFRDGARRSNIPISRSGGFRAALVGAGIARLIPAGGAITPVAMSWTVKDEAPSTSGAALRATVLNYGGLVGATGAGLAWVALRYPSTPARGGTFAIGAVALVFGGLMCVGSTRLTTLQHLVPHRWRARAARVLVDHDADARTFALLLARVLLEAAALGLTLKAFRLHLLPSETVAAFGISQLVGGLPGLPGGLGITEAGLVGALGLFGIPSSVGIGPVMVFRVISYWLPAMAGLAAGGAGFLRSAAGKAQVRVTGGDGGST